MPDPSAPTPSDQLLLLLARLAAALEDFDGIAPEGLAAGQAAAFVGVSRRKWYEMDAAGLCPASVQLGDRCPRWLKSELQAWLRHGAPTRVTWRQIRDQALRRTA
jgi:predicted DNA-binding transcriptional regulator AlpA